MFTLFCTKIVTTNVSAKNFDTTYNAKKCVLCFGAKNVGTYSRAKNVDTYFSAKRCAVHFGAKNVSTNFSAKNVDWSTFQIVDNSIIFPPSAIDITDIDTATAAGRQ
eukprot:TRINITY_DN605_c0_g1_i14.p2 TRINITY_DN605_c0_g1~~TRINITY_DN605_c0_g1_i14.p2  ORF type:complete len:107 (+),score=5.11 TRINITY_DN605_c0_g1_i14:191-511(+)